MPYNIIILKLLADHLYMFWCPDCLLLFQSDDDISFKEISIVKVETVILTMHLHQIQIARYCCSHFLQRRASGHGAVNAA